MRTVAGHRFTFPLLLILIFIIAEVIVKPLGEFPLNDDWSYSKSVLIFLNEGRIHIGHWPAMTLCTNILWGALFCSVAGFSFIALRLSTMVVAVTGILLMYAIVFRITKNRLAAFTASLTLLFNPYYFNLSNTFMTDVNFTVLLLGGIYVALRFFEARSLWWMIPMTLISVAAVLLRQFALVLPVVFVFVCLLSVRKHKLPVLFALLALIITCVSLYFFELYLSKILSSDAPYKYVFYGGPQPITEDPLIMWYLKVRRPIIITQVLMYSSPFAALLLFSLIRRSPRYSIIISVILSGVIYYYFFRDTDPLPGNVVANMHVGAETFYQNMNDDSAGGEMHTYSRQFEMVAEGAKLLLCNITLVAFFMFLIDMAGNRFRNFGKVHFFILLLMLSYMVLLIVANSYFDRYNLPLIALAIVMLGPEAAEKRDLPLSVFLMMCFAFFSVAGTKDYFALNRARWEAYYYLTKQLHVEHRSIQAGFEVKCWDEGGDWWWLDATTLENQKYLIQYDAEKGYVPFRKYTFQRYLPYRKDHLYIYERDSAKTGGISQ